MGFPRFSFDSRIENSQKRKKGQFLKGRRKNGAKRGNKIPSVSVEGALFSFTDFFFGALDG